MTGTESDTERLARAIIDMAEKDKGLVLSKLEDLIEQNSQDVRLAYGQGYDDGFEDAADAVETGALVERSAIPKRAFEEILSWKPKREAIDSAMRRTVGRESAAYQKLVNDWKAI